MVVWFGAVVPFCERRKTFYVEAATAATATAAAKAAEAVEAAEAAEAAAG